MKYKLITDGNNNYSLLDYNNDLIATTLESMVANKKLSLKNCESIKIRYEFDEYQEGVFYASKFGHPSPEGFSEEQVGRLHGFIDGFQKALEILSDKEFSRKDMVSAYLEGTNDGALYETTNSDDSEEAESFAEESLNTFTESLQKSEWNVEIEIEEVIIGQCDCECHSNTGIMVMHFMPCCNPKVVSNPKLDSNGCLILKKI